MKTYIFIITMGIGLALLSCSTDSTSTMYRLRTSANPADGGTIDPLGGEYQEGETVQIRATAHQQWAFTRWEGDHTGTSSTAIIMMDTDKNISAVFSKLAYPLTVEVQGEGAVNERVIPLKTTDYDSGTSVELTAVPDEGWAFNGWQGDAEGTENPITLQVDRAKTVIAVFAEREYPLTVMIQGEGTVTEEVVQAKTTNYPFQTLVRLTATASEGWHFTGWTGDLEGNENPATLEISGEKNVTATFEKNDYPLTINIIGEGTVIEEVVQAKTTNYPFQTLVTLTATPEQGWAFSHWEGDITGEQNPTQVEVNAAKEVTAVFIQDSYTITINLGGPGSWTVDLISGNQNGDRFEYGSVVRITVYPFQDWLQYRFVEWQGDLSGTENPIEVTVTGNITATAVMEQTLFEGEGTVENPFKVATLDQLQTVRGFIDKHFLQVADIDASETVNWNEGRGFQPIAFTGIGVFSGSYDGGGFKITNLYMDLRGGIYLESTFAGLFGRVKNALIKNITLEDIEIISVDGIPGTGGLAGWATSATTIQNVHVTGQISGHDNIGGLVGLADNARISGSTTNVSVSGNNGIGGLIGGSRAAWVSNSHATGNVTGQQSVGGLIGNQTEGEMITNSSAKGEVTGTINVGGLIGSSFNTTAPIFTNFATGNVSGDQNAGGLIGIYTGTGSIYQTYATGKVSSSNGSFIGGLIGRLTAGELSKSYALGDVAGATGVGGLIGRNDPDGRATEVYSAGKVSGTQMVGGLVGSNQGALTASYWDVETSGMNGSVWDPYQGTNLATGLTTAQMTGTNAPLNMPNFDWTTTWKISSSYPMLKNLEKKL